MERAMECDEGWAYSEALFSESYRMEFGLIWRLKMPHYPYHRGRHMNGAHLLIGGSTFVHAAERAHAAYVQVITSDVNSDRSVFPPAQRCNGRARLGPPPSHCVGIFDVTMIF